MENSNSLYNFKKLWWIPLITGLFFIGFGVWCLCDPGDSLKILAYILAGTIGAVGVFNVLYSIWAANESNGWGWVAAGGVVEILFSIFLFFIPGPILTWIFVYGVGFYIIFMGIFAFFDAFMRRYSKGWLLFSLLLLAATIAFALIFILAPVTPGVIGWLWIGVSFICFGVYRILLACRVHELKKEEGDDE